MRGKFAICFGGEVWTLGTAPWSTWELDDNRHSEWVWLTHMVPDKNTQVDPGTAIPQIEFSDEENRIFEENFKALPQGFGLLKATVGANRHGAAELKNWSVDGFVDVVAETPQITWVQVGQKGEPEVPGAINLLGKTSLREVLYLLSKAKLILSVEGFLTHASAAFGTPCFVPFTGVHEPSGLVYSNTIAIEPDPRPECMPCWQEICTTEGMPCRSNISSDRVIKSIRCFLQK